MSKASGHTFRESGKGSEKEKKKDYRGIPYRRKTFNPDKFCIAHHADGHATDDCSWLKGKLKDVSMPLPYAGKGKTGKEAAQSGEN